MKQYLDLCKKVLARGTWKENRTGIRHKGIFGEMMKFDLGEGFPAVTTKKLSIKSCIGEMLGFLRGYDNADQFEELGCNVWRANADENQTWLDNPNRKRPGDLGRVYGVQARSWDGSSNRTGNTTDLLFIDQLKSVVDKILQRKDDRRLIVSHWNPGEESMMALLPCHYAYQFNIEGEYLNLYMVQRSCDLPLGVPFNIAGYAWLLTVIAKITGFTPGTFTHFLGDAHIYENQASLMEEQVTRAPKILPELLMHEGIETLKDLETWVNPNDFALESYDPHPSIRYPFAV